MCDKFKFMLTVKYIMLSGNNESPMLCADVLDLTITVDVGDSFMKGK